MSETKETNDTEQLITFKKIPKAKRKGAEKNEYYERLYDVIMNIEGTEKGIDGQLNIVKTQCSNIRSALISRRKKDEIGDWKPFKLFTRNPEYGEKRATRGKNKGKMITTLLSGELYFRRYKKK